MMPNHRRRYVPFNRLVYAGLDLYTPSHTL